MNLSYNGDKLTIRFCEECKRCDFIDSQSHVALLYDDAVGCFKVEGQVREKLEKTYALPKGICSGERYSCCRILSVNVPEISKHGYTLDIFLLGSNPDITMCRFIVPREHLEAIISHLVDINVFRRLPDDYDVSENWCDNIWMR